jgi:hypothetical protein
MSRVKDLLGRAPSMRSLHVSVDEASLTYFES